MSDELIQAAEDLMSRIDNQGHRLALERALKTMQDSGDDKPLKQRLADYAARYPAEQEADELPDTFTAPTQSEMLKVKALPGYHTSLWRDNDMGLQKMAALHVTPVDAKCKYIPQSEIKRLHPGRHGLLCLGDLVVGIEKESHYAQRRKATVSEPASAQSKRLRSSNEAKPGDPPPFAVTTEKGTAPVLR